MTDKQVTHLLDLKRHYYDALRCGNIEKIITSGTDYFNELRGGMMTEEDRNELQKLVLRISNKQTIS